MAKLLGLFLYVISAQAFAQCKPASAEPFQDFIAQFSESKAFALSRTIYPTYTLRHEVGVENGKEMFSSVTTSISKATDETTPTIKQMLAKNQMVMEIKEVKNKKATVDIFKPDTDWLLTYHFVERRKCWYLHYIKDHSL